MEPKILSVESFGKDKIVKISVSSFDSLVQYQPKENEITVVVMAEDCPKTDLKSIETLCQNCNYSYCDQVDNSVENISSDGSTEGKKSEGSTKVEKSDGKSKSDAAFVA